jgi:AraC-like DNA-binding protein
MVMAFNPDEPHDGHAATEQGFTYRIVHIGPELVSQALDDAGLPLFVEPVMHDPVLAEALRCLHNALRDGSGLEQDEALDRTIRALVRRGATRVPPLPRQTPGVTKVREFLHDNHSAEVRADTLAEIAGGSRYAMYRGFIKQYGMPPSDYQRQLRMRNARRLLTQGVSIADSAVSAGFSDQSHFTRWFQRYYGITPGAFRDAA